MYCFLDRAVKSGTVAEGNGCRKFYAKKQMCVERICFWLYINFLFHSSKIKAAGEVAVGRGAVFISLYYLVYPIGGLGGEIK